MQSAKKKILIISFSETSTDPRVLRQIEYLKDEYTLTVAGIPPEIPSIEFIPVSHAREPFYMAPIIKIFLECGSLYPRIKAYSISFASKRILKNRNFDLIIANDLLPFAFIRGLLPRVPIFWDAHEFYPECCPQNTRGSSLVCHAQKRLCRKLIHEAVAMSSISPAICERYKKDFHLSERPLLLRNIPAYVEQSPSPVDNDRIRIVHHGLFDPARNPLDLINAVRMAGPRFSLDLILKTPQPELLDEIKAYIADMPQFRLLPPVSTKEIASFINRYDLGIILIPATNYNHEKCLPNKLFEFIQARLGIVIGPSPEMAEIVWKHGLGVISDELTPESMARTLQRLTQNDVVRFKLNANKIAHEFCAEKEMLKLTDAIRNVLYEKQC